MKLIDSIDRRPFSIICGKGRDAAASSVLRDVGTITEATEATAAQALADRSGPAVAASWADSWKNGCAGNPTDRIGGRIAGAAPPTVSSGATSEETRLTEWTTGFDVDSARDVTRPAAALTVAAS